MLKIEDRFFEKVFYCLSGCWLWTAALNDNGYGQFWSENKKQVRAHRWSYEHFVGKIPRGLTIDHECRVRNCVNPKHLKPKTNKENNLLGFSPSALNARKTHCPKNHEYSLENTHIRTDGARICKACNPLKTGIKGSGQFHKVKTHCKNGHEYTEENTILSVKKQGNVARDCKICSVKRKQKAWLKKKEGKLF